MPAAKHELHLWANESFSEAWALFSLDIKVTLTHMKPCRLPLCPWFHCLSVLDVAQLAWVVSL